VDGVKYFDQFCKLETFVQSFQKEEDFKNASVSEKYFQKSYNADSHSELLQIAEFFFSIPGHDANVERILSLMKAEWTGDRNRFTNNTINGVVLLQYKSRDIRAFSFTNIC
jgi:hypothetical protein